MRADVRTLDSSGILLHPLQADAAARSRRRSDALTPPGRDTIVRVPVSSENRPVRNVAGTLVMVMEFRFLRTPDGSVWTDTVYETSHWDRYLEVFSRVRLVARVKDVPAADPAWARVDDPFVTVSAVPHYIGPVAYVRRRRAVRRALAAAVLPGETILLRAPGQLAAVMAGVLASRGQRWAAMVVGDPAQSLATGATSHPLHGVFRQVFIRGLRSIVRGAVAVHYVSHGLKRLYPPSAGAIVTVGSDVVLPEGAFAASARRHPSPPAPTVITIGSLEQPMKGTAVLINACAACHRAGLPLRVTIVGEGRLRSKLERMARELGVGECVTFLGAIPAGTAVREQLDRASIFVLPSFTEGLSRALVEAMARGLPCIGSDVEGIAELLRPEDTVPPRDAGRLAVALRTALADPARLDEMSRRNLEIARTYAEGALWTRRRGWYESVRDALSQSPAPATSP